MNFRLYNDIGRGRFKKRFKVWFTVRLRVGFKVRLGLDSGLGLYIHLALGSGLGLGLDFELGLGLPLGFRFKIRYTTKFLYQCLSKNKRTFPFRGLF